MANPKVSVILTSYNHAAYIATAIESVLNQTLADFELLIVDDGSRDNSRDIIKTFDDPRIKTFLYEENLGSVIAVAEAVNSAQGKYIAVHHSDDMWAAEKLEKQVAFLDANENYAACFTWVNFIDEQGNFYEPDAKDFYRKIFEQPNRSRAEWLNYFFYKTNCLCHPSAMIRREVVKRLNLTDTHGFWQLPDYLMWIRLCFYAEIFILPERLTSFRLRRGKQENMSAMSFDKNVRLEMEFYFIAREFVCNFTDNKFFLEVFPEAEKFLVNEQINRRFAFAKICLDKKNIATSAFRLAGLEILKELLNSPANAAEIKTLYNYDEKSFLRDGGTYDVFNLAQKMDVLHAEIFIDNGSGYFLEAKKIIGVDAAGKFYGRIDFDSERPIKNLRFDPDTNFISVKINRVLINGAEQNFQSDNADKFVNGFHRFLTSDPQIIFELEDLSGHVTFEIFGEKEENYQAILNRNIKELVKVNEELKEINATLDAENRRRKRSEGLRNFLRLDNKEKVLSAARFFYKKLPLDDEKKVALKDKFYTTFAPILKNTKRYKIWQMAQLAQGTTNAPNFVQVGERFFDGELFIQPGKIAIQAHIFYLDLLEEMAAYCANMPYKFDALISIIDASAEEKVRSAFEKISNVEKCIVRVVPNRGRDVAPFIVGFGDLLPKYEFICHIHSKKSLYTGNEQQNWRKYLFKSLLGSPERLRKIFKAFNENPRLGLVYPQPSTIMPYIACTWLSNRQVGQELLRRAGIPFPKTTYFDFPVGTMFWLRSKALKKIFKLGLTIEDFPPEQKQNDGTIAHAFERSVALAAAVEGMDFYEFSPADESYSVNIGTKNLRQYLAHNSKDIFFVAKNEIVSFDIFDTLLMRLVAEPYHVNEIIRFKVEDLLGKNFDFPTLRIKAEENARRIKGGDVTLDDIYKSFGELAALDEQTCKKIRELEVETEVKLILPREEVVKWFKELRDNFNREIWLVSDMYMQTPDVQRLLEKCGVEGYDKLLISCETGMRKDTAEIWNHFMNYGLNVEGKMIHLGDNETSDIQLPGDRGFSVYHFMSALNLFTLTPFGKMLVERLDRKKSLYAGIFLGVLLAKKFQNPFNLNEDMTPHTGRIVIQNFRDLGYWFYGTPLLTFILWLIQRTRSDGIKQILFLARDGYFLQPLYKFVCEMLNVEPLPSNYFYASRRAVTVASIREISQTEDLLTLHFAGTLKRFFKVRFGIEMSDTTKIFLPEKDTELVREKIKLYSAEILSHAATERKNYEKYIDGLGGLQDNVGVVDMGYSGTIQYHLQRLTKKIFTGYYFATNMENRFGAESVDRMRGCFAENHDYGTTTSAVYKYHLLLESILTAPDAQLQYFDAEGKAVFGEPEPGQIHFAEIAEVHEGIKDFCRDVLENFGDIILRVPIDKNFVDVWVDSFVRDNFIISDNLRGIFDFDDVYCNALHGNALDFYRQSK